jgi:diguanylate cyclase (GGDEF)-like protein
MQSLKYFDGLSLSTYLLCPFKFKLSYIDKIGQLYKKPKPIISISESVHKVLSEFFILDLKERSFDTMLKLLNKHWISDGYSTNEEEVDYKHKAMTWLKNFFQSENINIFPLYINEHFRISIEDFYLTGKIDRIDETDAGVEIIDYKTSGKILNENSLSQDLQSGINAVACWEKLKLFPKKVSQIYLQYNQKISVIKTPQHLEMTKNVVKDVVRQIRLDETFVQKPNDSCQWCDFLTVCPEMGMGIKIVKQKNLEESFKELNSQLGKTVHDLSLLHKITLDISEFLDSGKLVNSIPEFIKGLVDVNNILVFIFDEEKQVFVLKKFFSQKNFNNICVKKDVVLKTLNLQEYEIPYSKIVTARDVNMIINDIFEEMLFLPLVAREKFLGFVFVSEKKDSKKFTNYDISLLQNLVTHISLVLQNIWLYELAITDGLTKLYIHRYFITRLEHEIRRAERYNTVFSLLMLDIDYFKQVNDTYGHLVGDEILRILAKILLSSVRDTDIVCRYGGEEFVIILLAADGKWAKKIGERIRDNVEKTEFKVLDKKIKITVSIGVKEFVKGDTVENFINKTDKALYLAKLSGRNKVVLYEESVS